jgi:hypothetical protein
VTFPSLTMLTTVVLINMDDGSHLDCISCREKFLDVINKGQQFSFWFLGVE